MNQGRLLQIWERFWFRACSSHGMKAARILIAANALWIVLSRPDLPAVLDWPQPFWAGVGALRIRYGYVLSSGAERVLYFLLCAALLAAMFGFMTRAAALVAGLLLFTSRPSKT